MSEILAEPTPSVNITVDQKYQLRLALVFLVDALRTIEIYKKDPSIPTDLWIHLESSIQRSIAQIKSAFPVETINIGRKKTE